MTGVGPGTTIARRYALRTLAHRAPQGQRWLAHDTATGTDVSVLLVPSASPVADAVAEAGRHAGVLEDPRLVPVLDVGEDGDHVYVVEGVEEHARPLRALLVDGPLAPEEARRVVGEAALVLERARQRGLHHERLTPEHVVVRRDGSVVLRGLAVDAALTGESRTDGRTASRTDAARLTAVLYAALTATWPLAGTDLTPSPRVGRTLTPPSELAPGIGPDLDALATSADGPDAPVIPGDVAERLAPWSDSPVGRVVDAGPPADTPAPEATTAVVDPSQLPDELRGDIEHPPSRAAVAAGAVAAAAAERSRATAEAARATARAAAERAAERRRDNAERKRAEKDSERTFVQIAQEAAVRRPEPVVPVLAKDVTTAVPSRRQAKFVLGFMGGFLALALVLGLLGIVNAVTTINDKIALGAGPAVTRTVTAPPVTVTAGARPAPAPSSSGPTPSTAVGIPVIGVSTFDPPPGDGNENDSLAAAVTDGDPGTDWRSQRYTTPEFSGLKPGIGLLLDLGQKATVRTATLTVPAAGEGEQVSVYVADERPSTLEGLTQIGSGTVTGTTLTLTAQADPGQHQYVLVWFTKAAPVSGGYRASVAEVALTS